MAMGHLDILSRSRALWNRDGLHLDSDEVLAQVLDRGSLEDWRALDALMAEPTQDASRLQERVWNLLLRVELGRPYFWIAALGSLGFPIDWTRRPRESDGQASF